MKLFFTRAISMELREAGERVPMKSVLWTYTALRDFDSELEKPEMRFCHLMKEGELVLFDNRRILHARTAFDMSTPGAERWLKGCYLDGEVVWDRLDTFHACMQ